jgi:LytS/YehU family sensor histidine kinase
MIKFNANKNSEKVIYLIFWILVFTFPILLSSGGNRIDWTRVLTELIGIFPYFLIFLLNNYILFRFLKSKKYFKYLLFSALFVIIFSFLGSFNHLVQEFLHIPLRQGSPGRQDTMKILNTLFYNSIISILVIGFNNAIKITYGWMEDRRNYEQLQKENFKNQLSLLQHQISPHFFMNTLNNIHALIDYDKEIAKNSVVKLSHLMRVLLYENENYTLQKEIDFLKDYIELMKIRVNQNVEIIFEHPEKIPQVNFPPLLFVSFVENSFKHGILSAGKSFIHMYFAFENDFLHVKIINSKFSTMQDKPVDVNIGLSNSQKRLDLIYNKNYKFDVIETITTYEVNIKVPLNEN